MLIINSGENTCRITKKAIESLPLSKHEEADTSLMFHAGMRNKVVQKYERVFTFNSCFKLIRMLFSDMVYED